MTVRWGARPGQVRSGRSAPAPRPANQLIGRHGSPVDFFFWDAPATAGSPEACLRALANRSAETKICYPGATAIGPVPPYQHRICAGLPVVHGTGTLQGPFETRNN
jgi:hypothetical protein